MSQKLIARLHDGSEYTVIVRHGTPEEALQRITQPGDRHAWLDVEGGKVRYEAVAAFLVVEEDPDRAITELLRELYARGGGTPEEVRGELERRGIKTPEKTGRPTQ